MTASWLSIVITLGIFVVTHIIITVWWASRVNTLLDIVQAKLGEIVVELKRMEHAYVTKEDAARELAIAEKEHKAIWKRLDELQTSAS
jgi:hypothetical protein